MIDRRASFRFESLTEAVPLVRACGFPRCFRTPLFNRLWQSRHTDPADLFYRTV